MAALPLSTVSWGLAVGDRLYSSSKPGVVSELELNPKAYTTLFVVSMSAPPMAVY